MKVKEALDICMVSPEALPYAKTGGLADVVGALPKALAILGCRVHLFHPYYRCVGKSHPQLEMPAEGVEFTFNGRVVRVDLLSHRPFPGVTAYLVREDQAFDREGLYGDGEGDYDDNLRRFALFCRAVLAGLEELELQPHLFHLHDWQTALIPLYLRHRRDLLGDVQPAPSLLTIHNMAYQGIFPRKDLQLAGIPESLFRMEGVEFYGKINLLKGGIVSADAVNTVSRKYSREIQTPEFGAGLEEVLRQRRDDLYGILNGADYSLWNPADDPYLSANYSLDNLSGKEVCKRDLLSTFGLAAGSDAPLMATISRLIDQKGFDIIAEALPALLDMGFRYLLLGTGEKRYQEIFTAMARRHPEKVAVTIAYDEPLSHRIEGGADFFLMPSRFEPCGLNQIYSLRYGTIPIVRATGGLDDTIIDYRPDTGEGNGLKFNDYSAEALTTKAHEARLIYDSAFHRARLIRNAMSADFSWESSARQYLDLYRDLIGSQTPEKP